MYDREPGGHLFLSDGGRLGRLEDVGIGDEVGTVRPEIFLDQRQHHLHTRTDQLRFYRATIEHIAQHRRNVCLPVTSRCSVKTTERIELASYLPLITCRLIMEFGYLHEYFTLKLCPELGTWLIFLLLLPT